MRAPQYGHNKGKRRCNNAALPAASLRTRFGVMHGDAAATGEMIRYTEPNLPCTMKLWHKSARREGVLVKQLQGNVITSPKVPPTPRTDKFAVAKPTAPRERNPRGLWRHYQWQASVRHPHQGYAVHNALRLADSKAIARKAKGLRSR